MMVNVIEDRSKKLFAKRNYFDNLIQIKLSKETRIVYEFVDLKYFQSK